MRHWPPFCRMRLCGGEMGVFTKPIGDEWQRLRFLALSNYFLFGLQLLRGDLCETVWKQNVAYNLGKVIRTGLKYIFIVNILKFCLLILFNSLKIMILKITNSFVLRLIKKQY